MIKGKEDVLAFIKSNNAPYWTIYPYNGGKTHCIFKSGDEPDLSLDKSIEKLSADLDILQSGRYVISSKIESTQTKNLREDSFEHTNLRTSEHHNTSVVPAIAGITEDMIEKRIQNELQKFKDQLERNSLLERIRNLETELKESKDSNFEASISGVIKKLDPFIDPIMNHMFPAKEGVKIAVSGLQNNSTTTTKTHSNMTDISADEATQRVQIALDKLLTADPERALLVIEKIAETATIDYQTYNMYAGMLLKK